MPMHRSSVCYGYSRIYGRRGQSHTCISPASELHPQHLPYHRTKRPDALMRWFSFRYRYSRTIVRRDQMRSCAGLASTTATPVPTALMQWSSTSSHYPISRSGIHIHGGQSRPNSRLTFAAPIHRVASPSVPGTARRFRALLEVPPARPLLREVAHCPGPD
ncbi:hypothetical protein FA13DRAFT_21323 [Coprinellus micaceus]|uniref:Uncharacterized protein n=1 Tax=Coprinellus micaceus TaxID=71717 RepID=A0A4Y7TZZ3_COPMI|nr:hypothetical protein FA13DRAFT_21323 [Coprinellus micaceus]